MTNGVPVPPTADRGREDALGRPATRTGRWGLPRRRSSLNRRLEPADVAILYNAILRRPPESEQIVASHVRSGVTVADFLRGLLESAEFGSLCRHLVRRLDVDATPDQLARLRKQLRDVWAHYGDSDPFWSVVTADEYRMDRIAETEELFYATGAGDAAAMRELAESHGLALPSTGTVVDVGCGLGRVGEHLARMFASYCGVDISAPHLEIAAARFRKLGIENVELVPLMDYLQGTGSYDALYSVIMLQHSPPPLMCDMLRCMLGSLRSGGVGVFQLPCASAGYGFVLDEYLADLESHSMMEMHAVPLHVVEQIISGSGCRLVASGPDGHEVPNGVSHMFLVQKL